jgi:hypothetical protein
MLLSTTGVRISQHWCGDQLVNATIWGEAEACNHAIKMVDCPIHGKMLVDSKKCCDQREITIEPNEDDYIFSAYFLNINVESEFFVFAIESTEIICPQFLNQKFYNHSPPLIGLALFKLTESYRI